MRVGVTVAERAKPVTASEKVSFLLVLVPFLIDNERISVTEVAAHFAVTEQQVRDAISLISVSGVPGETGTYQHNDLFDVAWDEFLDHDIIQLTNLVAIDETPKFSAREASALIAGLQYLSSLPENADRSAIATLMAKLAEGSSATPVPVAVEGADSDSTIALIRRSVTDGVQLEMEYLNQRGEQDTRRVDALRVESLGSDWFLKAWCHLREGVRTFRLDRIRNPRLTDDPVAKRASDVALSDTLFDPSSADTHVTLEIAATAVGLIADFRPVEGPSEREGFVTATIAVPHFHGLKRLMAELSGVATVIAPQEARRAVSDWAHEALAGYDTVS